MKGTYAHYTFGIKTKNRALYKTSVIKIYPIQFKTAYFVHSILGLRHDDWHLVTLWPYTLVPCEDQRSVGSESLW